MTDVGEMGMVRLARAVRRARGISRDFVLLRIRSAPSLDVTQLLPVVPR